MTTCVLKTSPVPGGPERCCPGHSTLCSRAWTEPDGTGTHVPCADTAHGPARLLAPGLTHPVALWTQKGTAKLEGVFLMDVYNFCLHWAFDHLPGPVPSYLVCW